MAVLAGTTLIKVLRQESMLYYREEVQGLQRIFKEITQSCAHTPTVLHSDAFKSQDNNTPIKTHMVTHMTRNTRRAHMHTINACVPTFLHSLKVIDLREMCCMGLLKDHRFPSCHRDGEQSVLVCVLHRDFVCELMPSKRSPPIFPGWVQCVMFRLGCRTHLNEI